MLFRALELGGGPLQMLVAGIEVDRDPVGQLFAGASHSFLQESLGLFEFVLLHGTQPGLVVLHSLCKTRIFTHGFLGCGFLRHPQNSSWTLRKLSFFTRLGETALEHCRCSVADSRRRRCDCWSGGPGWHLWKRPNHLESAGYTRIRISVNSA